MHAYALVKKIAAGGMAEVFLARMKGAGGFEKPVAVKRVLPSMAQDPRFIEMFVREARLTVALQHANVVQVLDLGTAGSQYFMVLEFVDGENLRAVQRAAQKRNVPIGLKEALFIVQQVSEGLAYAHERTDPQGRPLHIIHRDINPSNIMVSRTGEVKLADFGIARAADFNAGTQVGVVKGKSGYIAPELLTGAPPDQRSDLFLMGVLLYELLSGKQLFEGGNYFQTLKQIAAFDVRQLPTLPGVPPPLWAIITRALAQDPAARFQRARDLAEALRSYLFDYRLKVSAQDIAALFSRVFVDRRSPLELPTAGPEYEIRLDPAAISHEQPPSRTGTLRSSPSMGSRGSATKPVSTPSAAAPASWNSATPTPNGSGHRKLGEILLAQGKLTPARLQAVLHRQERIGARLGEVLVSEGQIEEDDLVRALAEQMRHAFVTSAKLRSMPIPPPDVLRHLPAEKAQRFNVVPLMIAGRELVVAMTDPRNLASVDAVKFAAGMLVRPVLGGERAIRMGIRRFYFGEDPNAELGFEAPSAFPQDQGITPFSDRVTGTRERVFGEEELGAGGEAESEKRPESDGVPAPGPCSVRPTLLVCDDAGSRESAVKLLLRRGINVAGSDIASAPEALTRGQFEQVLLSAEGTADAASALAALKSKHPKPEYHLVSSFAEALVGESTAVESALKLQSRLLESALGAMGGVATQAAALSRLSSAVAEHLGASAPGARRAAVGACAFLFAAALQRRDRFERPAADAVRAVLGRDAADLEDVLAGSGSPAAVAVHAALCLLEETGSASPTAVNAGRALTSLREREVLEPDAMEALASVLSETLLRHEGGAPVILLFEDGMTGAQIHTRLLADGIRAMVARTTAEVERFVAEGASALVASTRTPGVDPLALIRGLRASAHAQTLPVFLLAGANQASLVEAGLDAGADDVLEQPVNVDVLAAKLRRALAHQKAGPHQPRPA